MDYGWATEYLYAADYPPAARSEASRVDAVALV